MFQFQNLGHLIHHAETLFLSILFIHWHYYKIIGPCNLLNGSKEIIPGGLQDSSVREEEVNDKGKYKKEDGRKNVRISHETSFIT
jgi:hypothetical protein